MHIDAHINMYQYAYVHISCECHPRCLRTGWIHAPSQIPVTLLPAIEP